MKKFINYIGSDDYGLQDCDHYLIFLAAVWYFISPFKYNPFLKMAFSNLHYLIVSTGATIRNSVMILAIRDETN